MVDGEKWDPLIKLKSQTCSTFSEDRAKLIKSKKLGPLLDNCKGDLAVLECDKCNAFFIEQSDFDTHFKCHVDSQSNHEATSIENLFGTRQKLNAAFVTSNAEIETVIKETCIKNHSIETTVHKKSRIDNTVEKANFSEHNQTASENEVYRTEQVETKLEISNSKLKNTITDPYVRIWKQKSKISEDNENDKCEKIYTCAHCLRNFRRKSNLKRHMSKLHSVKRNQGPETDNWFTGYCCDVCGEGLQIRSVMMAHREVVHSDQEEMEWCKYQTSLARVKFCDECKKYFRSGKVFEEHTCKLDSFIVDQKKMTLMKRVEEKPPSYFCDICSLCFRWKWDSRLHRDTDHKDAPPINWSSLEPTKLEHVCEGCCKVYADETSLNQHTCTAIPVSKKKDTLVKPFRCDFCGSDYCWKSDWRRHMRTKHPKENFKPTEHDTIVYSCPYCEEKFSTKKRILGHMGKEHSINSDSPFVCVKCNKVFRRRDNLDRHNESYHPSVKNEEADSILKSAEIRINGDILYHCQVCNRNIVNPNRFISHYRGHYSENKFTCDMCGKQVKTQHQLNTHIKNIHLNIRNYKCDFCDKSFYTKQACEEHRRIHTGERPFSCEICGKTFVAGNALISHKRFHNDFYPHSCHLCPKKFKVRRSLINHVRTHTGERPFKCNLCTKTFNNSSQYSYHTKVTHSEARPFMCPLCGNRFKANKFLTRHMDLHAQRNQARTDRTQYVVTEVAKRDTSQHMTVIPIPQTSIEVTVPAQTITIVPDYNDKALANFKEEEVSVTLYNVQRNDLTRQDGDLEQMKASFTAAQAYMNAASYALAPSIEDYKESGITHAYSINQVPGSAALISDKEITWL